jgi:hypothetical protein
MRCNTIGSGLECGLGTGSTSGMGGEFNRRRNTTRRSSPAWRWSNSSIESQDLRHRSRSSRAQATSATQWPLFQRSQNSAFCFGMNHVHACPSICIPFQRARLEGRVLRRSLESAVISRHHACN